jgi:hypothetical protein
MSRISTSFIQDSAENAVSERRLRYGALGPAQNWIPILEQAPSATTPTFCFSSAAAATVPPLI